MTPSRRAAGEVPDPGRDRWRETIRAKALGGAPERREAFETSSGIVVRDLYTPADLAGMDEARDLGRPGEYPFTRGVQPTMYRSRFWTMRQYAGFATAEETNQRFRYLLDQGQTGLSVAFDLPTQMGYDSDAPEAEGEVGRVGVPIASLADMSVLLDGLPLGKVSTSMTINATAPILLALYVAAAEAQGVPRAEIAGTTQNDILKDYIARGPYIFPPRPSMRARRRNRRDGRGAVERHALRPDRRARCASVRLSSPNRRASSARRTCRPSGVSAVLGRRHRCTSRTICARASSTLCRIW